MEYKSLITVSTIAEKDKKYEIVENKEFKIGEAVFLRKEDDEFVFDVSLSGKRELDDYNFKFDVDADSYELLRLRAELRK